MIPASNVPSYSPVVQVLREARALVAKGWCQQQYRSTGGRYCALGAVFASTLGMQVRHAANNALRAAVGNYSVSVWNDAPGRTQLEVLEAFNHAIAIAIAAGESHG